MDVVISNVGCSILASIIYDISKVCLGKFYYKNDEHSIEKIEELIREKLDGKYEILYMSGEFNAFLQTPFLKILLKIILYIKLLETVKVIYAR